MKTYRKDLIYIAAMAILVLLLLKQCNSTADVKREKAIADQNVFVLKDTIRSVKNKAKELQFQHGILIADKNNLIILNAELADEVKKQIGKVIFLQSVVAELKNKPPRYIPTTVYVYPDGRRSLKWNYDTTFSIGNSRAISGESFFKIDSTTHEFKVIPMYTNLTKDLMSLKFTTGITKNTDLNRYEIFVKSDYPGFSVSKIDGAFIPTSDPIFGSPPKPKRFGVGVNLGGNVSYNPFTRTPYIGIGIQVGLQYNFKQF
jgi:hypothetical protein